MEARMARLMGVLVLVGAGMASCAVPEPTRTPNRVPIESADSFVPLGELWPSGCRGDMSVGRTVQEVDAAQAKPKKLENIPTRIIKRSELKSIQTVFDLLTCGEESVQRVETQDETVKPCGEEMTVKQARERLQAENYYMASGPSRRTAVIALRRILCPAGTPTPKVV